jgi:chromosome segregation ATPase
MKRNLLLSPGLYLTCIATALAQSGPAPAATPANGGQGQPVSYASLTQLNGLLSQIEATAKNAQTDLGKLRIERWKADNSYKKQALGNVDSVQRNLQGALPEIISQLRNAPEDLPASFKLYRNLDALYDVLRGVTEDAAAYGSKDDLQALSNDLSAFEGSRKQLAERIETLSSSKESELTRLRAQLKTLQTQVEAAAPPKKIVVDDTEPAKKPAPKKKTTTPAAKKPADSTKPSAATGQATPPAQQAPPKPQ